MTGKRLREKFMNYQKALQRLDESLGIQNPDEYIYEAAVKRFEFTYELGWKLMKAYIEYKGSEDVRFQRDVFREAFANGLLRNGEVWLQMMKDRNLSSLRIMKTRPGTSINGLKKSIGNIFLSLP